jgi:hypothetical protein
MQCRFEERFSKRYEMSKMCCAALDVGLVASAAISQVTILFHRHLTGFCADLRAGEEVS